jgi:type I restriction enzyme, S subunit
MSNDWKLQTLREAGVSLIDCDHRTPPPANTGYPYVAIPQLKQGRLDLSDVRRITHEHFLEWTRKANPQANDVVLSRRCNPGETAVVPTGLECALGQNLVLLRADAARMFPQFLRWLVRGSEWWEQIGKFLNVGAVFDSLRCADIPNFQLQIPPLSEQRAIASVLGALDDKIELNRRMNETLDELAQNIFKSRFVDIPAKLPKGWNVRALYDCADYINGAAFRNEHFSAERHGLPVVKIGELKDGITAQTKFCEVEREPKYRIASGDVLFSWSGSPDTSIDTFVWTGGDGWLNQHIFKIQFKRPVEKYFVYYLLRQLKPVFIEIARDKQTTGLGHVTGQDLKRLKTVFPPDDVLQEFNEGAEPLFQKVYSNLLESRTLAELRDTLLPKLLSGELRVAAVIKLQENRT